MSKDSADLSPVQSEMCMIVSRGCIFRVKRIDWLKSTLYVLDAQCMEEREVSEVIGYPNRRK